MNAETAIERIETRGLQPDSGKQESGLNAEAAMERIEAYHPKGYRKVHHPDELRC